MGITMKHFGAFRATGALLFFPERGALTHHPEGGGGIACGNRALCEADAASAEALWTMPQLCGIAVIVHAVGVRRLHPLIPSFEPTVFHQLPA